MGAGRIGGLGYRDGWELARLADDVASFFHVLAGGEGGVGKEDVGHSCAL